MATDIENSSKADSVIEDHLRLKEEKDIKENCDYIISFIDQLSKADYSSMTEISKKKIEHMKSVMEEYCQLHDEMTSKDKKIQKHVLKIEKGIPAANKELSPKVENQSKDEGSSEEASDEDSSDEENSETNVSVSRSVVHQGRPSRSKQRKSKEESFFELLADKLDNRKVVDFRKFDEDGSQSLDDYLVAFEKYCKNNIRGDKDTWADELLKYLSGDILTAYVGLKDANQSYEIIKTKLLTWYKGRHNLRKKRIKERFNNVSYEKGETLFLYSSRIEILFGQAYPKKNPETSKILVRKFIDTLPEFEKNRLSAVYEYDRLKGNSMKWSEIQKYASMREVELVDNKGGNDDDKDHEIVINVKKNVPIQTEEQNEIKIANVMYSSNSKPANNNQNKGPNNQNQNNGSGYNRFPVQQTRYFTPRHPPRPYFNNQRPQQNHNRFTSPYAPQYNRGPAPNQNRFSAPPQQSSRFCNYCRRMGHLENACFKKSKDACYTCGKLGHISRFCRQNFYNRQRSQSQPPNNRNEQQNQNNATNNSNENPNNTPLN